MAIQVRKETILNVFPGVEPNQRLAVVLLQEADGERSLELRQETHSADVGWFVQSRVAVDAGQIPGLKMTLTSPATSSGLARSGQPTPAILSFAAAKQAG